MNLLLQRYDDEGSKSRRVRHLEGTQLDATISQDLLEILRSTDWDGMHSERASVRSLGYLLLKRPPAPILKDAPPISKTARLAAAKLNKHQRLWDLASKALASVDPIFASIFSAIAVSNGFVGSPHIDSFDVDCQYAFSCGDFSGGGKLCVECSAREVAEIDTRMRLAKVDGRFPHWVTPYEGERYSIIWFRTEGLPSSPTTAVFS